MEKGFKITTKEFKVIGKLNFNESVDLSLIALNHFMLSTYEQLKTQDNPEIQDLSEEEKDKTIRAVVYDKAVIAFSVMMDEFFPEAKDLKTSSKDFLEWLKKNDSNKQE